MIIATCKTRMKNKGNPTVIHILCVLTVIIEDAFLTIHSKQLRDRKCLPIF